VDLPLRGLRTQIDLEVGQHYPCSPPGQRLAQCAADPRSPARDDSDRPFECSLRFVRFRWNRLWQVLALDDGAALLVYCWGFLNALARIQLCATGPAEIALFEG